MSEGNRFAHHATLPALVADYIAQRAQLDAWDPTRAQLAREYQDRADQLRAELS